VLRYLYIRILEACNAGCWFCGFAKSRDLFRLSVSEFSLILDECAKNNVEYIRFTGGETLLHDEIISFINLASEKGIKTSIITNGFLLPQNAENLASAGLDQVIVSIDDVYGRHDNNRCLKGLWKNANDGLVLAKKYGISTRVNTICGPHNFKQIPVLKKHFSRLGIDYWEVSALKLKSKIKYIDLIDTIEDVINEVYKGDGIIPYGKIWCGNSQEERDNYFKNSIPPRVDGNCRIAKMIRFYDAKNRNIYVCSLLVHRLLSKNDYYHFDDEEKFCLNNEVINGISEKFYTNGHNICNGCSASSSHYGGKAIDEKEAFKWEH
jgi:cytosylglucuronate decarboxylase